MSRQLRRELQVRRACRPHGLKRDPGELGGLARARRRRVRWPPAPTERCPWRSKLRPRPRPPRPRPPPTTTTTTTTTTIEEPIPRLTKVGFTARGKGGTIAATLVVPREARGSVLLLQRKKTMARWKLSLAQGRRVQPAGAPPAKRLVRTALPPGRPRRQRRRAEPQPAHPLSESLTKGELTSAAHERKAPFPVPKSGDAPWADGMLVGIGQRECARWRIAFNSELARPARYVRARPVGPQRRTQVTP